MGIRQELERRERSGLGELLDKTFDNYEVLFPWQKHIVKEACDYVRNPDHWFYIGGQPGCGKTHICIAIVNALIKRGKCARYMVWDEEIDTIKQSSTDAAAYEKLMNGIKKAEVLYIDDFFKSKSITNADINTTFKILNYRYNGRLPTIISSELSIKEVGRIDEALGSRIAEMVKGRDIHIDSDPNKNYRYHR